MHYRYGGHDVFALPGGNPDRNETLPQTVARELQEELGVTADIGAMVLAGEMLLSQRSDDVLHIVFAASNLQGEPVLNPAETSAIEVVWKPLDELDRLHLYPNVGQHIQRWFTQATELGYVGRIEQAYFE